MILIHMSSKIHADNIYTRNLKIAIINKINLVKIIYHCQLKI